MSVSKEELAAIVVAALQAAEKAKEAKGGDPTQDNQWTVAQQPMLDMPQLESPELDNLVTIPDAEPVAKKKLLSFKTYTFIDDLFLTHDNKSIKGLPAVVQCGIIGLSGSGKSILLEEIAIKVAAKKKKVLLVSTEDSFKSPTARFDLQARLMQKVGLLGLDWKVIKDNLFVMDAIANKELREWSRFAETYKYICEKKDIVLTLIDSVTMLDSTRGALKYRLMELSRFNQMKGITALYVNQRTGEEWDKYAVAGGMAIPHNLDATILIDYGRTYYADQIDDLGKRGTFVRMARVMDCRMCNFNRDRVPILITPDGFLRLSHEPIIRAKAKKK